MKVSQPEVATLVAPAALRTWSPEIDGLRGLAAMTVVVGHAMGFLLPPALIPNLLRHIVGISVRGSVVVFFVLSGYCIHLRRAATLPTGERHALRAGGFYLRRLKRLYPTFAVALVVGGLLDLASVHFGHPIFAMDLKPATFLVSLGLQQTLAGPIFGSNGSTWSLAYEAYFYLAYPLIWVAMQRWPPRRVVLVVFAGSLVAYVGTRFGLSFYLTPLLMLWATWCVGVLVAEQRQSSGALVGFFGIGTLALAALYMLKPRGFVLDLALTCVAVLLIRGAVTRHPLATVPRRALAAVAPIGMISFSLYLVHAPLLMLIASLHGRSVAGVDSLGVLVLTILLCFLAGYLLFLGVERRSLPRPPRRRIESGQETLGRSVGQVT